MNDDIDNMKIYVASLTMNNERAFGKLLRR